MDNPIIVAVEAELKAQRDLLGARAVEHAARMAALYQQMMTQKAAQEAEIKQLRTELDLAGRTLDMSQ